MIAALGREGLYMLGTAQRASELGAQTAKSWAERLRNNALPSVPQEYR